jgi:hypothetical protein
MRLEDYDRVTVEFKVHEKGDEDRPALVDGRARRLSESVRRWPRRYTGSAAKRRGARLMPQHSPID